MYEVSFKKKEQAITLDTKSVVRIDNETVKVDPQLLFQRLIVAARGVVPEDEHEDTFSFELYTYPPALRLMV